MWGRLVLVHNQIIGCLWYPPINHHRIFILTIFRIHCISTKDIFFHNLRVRQSPEATFVKFENISVSSSGAERQVIMHHPGPILYFLPKDTWETVSLIKDHQLRNSNQGAKGNGKYIRKLLPCICAYMKLLLLG